MARRRTRTRKAKARARTTRKQPARGGRASAPRRTAAAAGSARRITELQAENRRLRAEIAALQARLADRQAPAFNLAAEEDETSPTPET